jgi:hypothetical protein
MANSLRLSDLTTVQKIRETIASLFPRQTELPSENERWVSLVERAAEGIKVLAIQVSLSISDIDTENRKPRKSWMRLKAQRNHLTPSSPHSPTSLSASSSQKSSPPPPPHPSLPLHSWESFWSESVSWMPICLTLAVRRRPIL